MNENAENIAKIFDAFLAIENRAVRYAIISTLIEATAIKEGTTPIKLIAENLAPTIITVNKKRARVNE